MGGVFGGSKSAERQAKRAAEAARADAARIRQEAEQERAEALAEQERAEERERRQQRAGLAGRQSLFAMLAEGQDEGTRRDRLGR